MKAMNFQDDIPSIPFNNFKDRFLLVFFFTSMQNSTENCPILELVEELLRLLLKIGVPLGFITELIVLGERSSLVENDNFGVVVKNLQKEQRCSPAFYQSFPFTQVSVPFFFPSIYVPILLNETFGITNTQPEG